MFSGGTTVCRVFLDHGVGASPQCPSITRLCLVSPVLGVAAGGMCRNARFVWEVPGTQSSCVPGCSACNREGKCPRILVVFQRPVTAAVSVESPPTCVAVETVTYKTHQLPQTSSRTPCI